MNKKNIISNILITVNIIIILAIVSSFMLVCFSNRSLVSIMGTNSTALYMNDETIHEQNGKSSDLLLIQNTDTYDVNDKIIFRTKDIFDNDIFQMGYVQTLDYDGSTYSLTINDNLTNSIITVSYSDCVGKVTLSNKTLGAFIKMCDHNIKAFYFIIQMGILFVVLSSIIMIILLKLPNKAPAETTPNDKSELEPSSIAPVKLEDELSLDIKMDDMEALSLQNIIDEIEYKTPSTDIIEETHTKTNLDGIEVDTQTITSNPFIIKTPEKEPQETVEEPNQDVIEDTEPTEEEPVEEVSEEPVEEVSEEPVEEVEVIQSQETPSPIAQEPVEVQKPTQEVDFSEISKYLKAPNIFQMNTSLSEEIEEFEKMSKTEETVVVDEPEDNSNMLQMPLETTELVTEIMPETVAETIVETEFITDTDDVTHITDDIYIKNTSSGDSAVDAIIDEIIKSLSKNYHEETELAVINPTDNMSLQLINAILEENTKEITQNYASDDELDQLKQEILNNNTYQ